MNEEMYEEVRKMGFLYGWLQRMHSGIFADAMEAYAEEKANADA